MKIAVFDSGEGCKYVAGELRKEFPQWKIVTYEDRDNFPYGGKTKRELNKTIQETIDIIYQKFHPDGILVASYTPSLQVFSNLKSKCKLFKMGLPFKKNTTLLVTNGLSKSEVYLRKTKYKNITTVPISNLARLIQDNVSKNALRDEIIKVMKNVKTKTIILGCTHLSVVKTLFEKLYPRKIFIDPVENLIKSFRKG